MKTICELEKRIPVIAEADVVVLGGGPAGISAAIGAADAGAATILVERYGWLGGQATGGYVIWLYGVDDGKDVIVKGFCEEVLGCLSKLGAHQDLVIDPEYLKYVLVQSASKRSVELYLHHWAVGATLTHDLGRVEAVIVESKSGREAILGQVFVDATGDGDMAEWCGVPVRTLPKGVEPLPVRWGMHIASQRAQMYPATLCYRLGNVDIERATKFQKEEPDTHAALIDQAEQEVMFRPHWGAGLSPGEVIGEDICLSVNPCNAKDLSWAEVNGLKRVMIALEFYCQRFPGFENARLISIAPQLGVRESRRICGQVYLDTEVLNGKIGFSDSIALAPIEISLPTKGGKFSIPYRALIPLVGPKNLLFAGRCISMSHAIIDRIRLIGTCMATGQAAGIAAALTGSNDVDQIEIEKLHKELTAQNCIF